jgi:hypothetical protein
LDERAREREREGERENCKRRYTPKNVCGVRKNCSTQNTCCGCLDDQERTRKKALPPSLLSPLLTSTHTHTHTPPPSPSLSVHISLDSHFSCATSRVYSPSANSNSEFSLVFFREL